MPHPPPSQRSILALLALAVGLFGCMGTLVVVRPELVVKLFDLDRELSFPTLFSSAVLAADAWLVRALIRRRTLSGVHWGLAALFALMAVDEVAWLHERLEQATGVDWQILYSPVFLAGGVAWLAFAGVVRGERASLAMWLAGGLAWAASQIGEAVQWDWDTDAAVRGYDLIMVTEELLEMTGSCLFLGALLRTSTDGASAPAD